MKSLIALFFAITSLSAFAKGFTCECRNLAGCPERLTVEVKKNSRGELIGQIYHFDLVSKNKLKAEKYDRTLSFYEGKDWVLTRNYHANGRSTGSLNIVNEDLAREL